MLFLSSASIADVAVTHSSSFSDSKHFAKNGSSRSKITTKIVFKNLVSQQQLKPTVCKQDGFVGRVEAQVPQNKQSQSLRSGSTFRERKQQRQRFFDLENHALTFAAEGQVDEELEPE